MLRDGLRHPVEDTTEVVKLAGQLHLHDDDIATLVFRLDINPIKLVGGVLLVALALQDLDDLYLLTREDGNQSLQYGEVRLVTQHAHHGPIKSDVFLVHLHDPYVLCREITYNS